MADLSEILGALMVGLVHARRMADEETAAVAEYYKDHPLLEGMSLPRVRVPELTIDMPITFDAHIEAKDALLDTPSNIIKATTSQLRQTLDDEDILSRTQSFQKIFQKETTRAVEELAEVSKNQPGKISREAVVRAVDDALHASFKKADLNQQLPADKKTSIAKAIRHKISTIALKSHSSPTALKASAVTSDVKEKATRESSVNLSITLKEEGLEWATNQTTNGANRNRLQPE